MEYGVGYVVFAGAVALHNGGHHVLGHVGIVGQQLFGVFGQAVATVAERGVVVVGADAGVEAYTIYNGLGVETFDLGICVELVEVADAQGQVGVGEEFNGFGLLHAHEECGYVLFLGTLLQQVGEGLGGLTHGFGVGNLTDGVVLLLELGVVDEFRIAHYDAAGVEVVVEGLTLAEELGREDEVELFDAFLCIAEVEGATVAHGYGGFDDHDGLGVDTQHGVYDVLDAVSIEEVFNGVVVGGGCNDHEVGLGVGFLAVEGGGEVQLFLLEVFFYVLVLNG